MVALSTLQFCWFAIFVILLTGYAILDGFDLGVGMLHLFTKDDRERRIMLNSIGPVWDGNEVWLVTAGGALFAGFPAVYAAVCQSFYFLIMLLLAGIIFRAVAIEFRSKESMWWWRAGWDWAFALASLVIAFGLGVVLGNLIRGVPLDERGDFSGNTIDLFNPYALLVGVLAVSLFCMHGSIYALMKTEGELHDKLRGWVKNTMIFFIVTYALTTVATLIYEEHMAQTLRSRPHFFVVAVIGMLLIANIPREMHLERDGRAFLSSCGAIVCLLALFGIGIYPTALRAINDPENLSLTIYNSSSSFLTLKILMIMAFLGVPLVLSYTISIYWVFRGKVELNEHSY